MCESKRGARVLPGGQADGERGGACCVRLIACFDIPYRCIGSWAKSAAPLCAAIDTSWRIQGEKEAYEKMEQVLLHNSLLAFRYEMEYRRCSR